MLAASLSSGEGLFASNAEAKGLPYNLGVPTKKSDLGVRWHGFLFLFFTLASIASDPGTSMKIGARGRHLSCRAVTFNDLRKMWWRKLRFHIEGFLTIRAGEGLADLVKLCIGDKF